MIHSKPMRIRLVRRNSVKLSDRGRRSPLSVLLGHIQRMKYEDELTVAATRDDQREVAARIRSNIFKWKIRHGIAHVGVHLAEKGLILLRYEKRA